MNEKTARELIEALEAIEAEFGNLPVVPCSVAHEYTIIALVVTENSGRIELQIARSS